MDKNKLLNEYKEFLKATCIESSAKWYVDYYLLGGFKNIINPIFEKTFNKKIDILEYFCTLNLNTRRLLCELFIMMIKQDKENKNSNLKQKTLSNYNSSFVAFLAFNDTLRFRGNDEYDKLLTAFNYHMFFTKKDIIDNFEFRINTQDRFYPHENVCLPCRLLNKIYQKDKRYKSIIDKMLKNCKLLIDSNGNFVKLKDVNNISILNREFIVCYGSKGMTAKLYTELNKKGTFLGYGITKGDALKDISLDHDISLFTFYQKYLFDNNAPTLKRLSDDYYDYHINHKAISESSLPCHYYDNRYHQLNINEQELLKEVDAFFSKIKLTVMDKSVNSSKNKY